jgi:multidrug efflux pump
MLKDIYVIGNNDQRVPLSAFSRYSYSIAPDRILHKGPFAAMRVSFALAPGVTFSQAAAAIEEAMARVMLPTEVQSRFEGRGRMSQTIEKNQVWLLLGVLLTVYVLLGVLYESFIHPLTILSALPAAGVGAFMALLTLRIEFSLIALLGLFLLIGLVMKNAILIVDFALSAQRREGLTAEQAIRHAAMLRLRPILMTSAAAVLGALPLMLAVGEGAEMRRPLGVTIVGGLLVSQLLTLYLTPVVYLYLHRVQEWSQVRRAEHRQAIALKASAARYG